eukprot:513126-Prymnesium_polylepis.1
MADAPAAKPKPARPASARPGSKPAPALPVKPLEPLVDGATHPPRARRIRRTFTAVPHVCSSHAAERTDTRPRCLRARAVADEAVVAPSDGDSAEERAAVRLQTASRGKLAREAAAQEAVAREDAALH